MLDSSIPLPLSLSVSGVAVKRQKKQTLVGLQWPSNRWITFSRVGHVHSTEGKPLVFVEREAEHLWSFSSFEPLLIFVGACRWSVDGPVRQFCPAKEGRKLVNIALVLFKVFWEPPVGVDRPFNLDERTSAWDGLENLLLPAPGTELVELPGEGLRKFWHKERDGDWCQYGFGSAQPYVSFSLCAYFPLSSQFFLRRVSERVLPPVGQLPDQINAKVIVSLWWNSIRLDSNVTPWKPL